MTDYSTNNETTSWSELLRRIISVETSHASPVDISKLTDKDLSKLRDLVSRQDRPDLVHGSKAISALVERLPTNETATLLDQLIANPDRSLSERIFSVIEMQRLPAEAVEKRLVRHLKLKEPKLLYRIAQTLGRIGGPGAIKHLEAVDERQEEYIEKQIDFSKRLIQYRHGLQSKEALGLSGSGWVVEADMKTIPLSIPQLERERLDICLEKLKDKHLGIDLANDPGFTLDLDFDNYLILDQRLMTEAGRKHSLNHPSISGVGVSWSDRVQAPELNQYLLTTPVSRGLLLHSYRLDGILSYEGHGTFRNGVLYFKLVSLECPGQCLFRIQGKFHKKGLEIDLAETSNKFPSKAVAPC